ncbi:MAG: D-alanine--D-alanine ligase [bacterium]|nr:D-alanine--D-alanine ligase [bacterium]
MKVLLLAGGDSQERDVSISSGEAVFNALSRLGHRVFAVDPVSGKSLVGSDNKFITTDASDSGKTATLGKTSVRSVSSTIFSPGFQDIDVIFVAMHGGLGENGTLQSLLNLVEKNYTGSCMLASAVAMDKALAKRLFLADNITTPDWYKCRVRDDADIDRAMKQILDRFQFPIIVKPNNGGSTIGLTKVDSADGVGEALNKAAEQSPDILVEDYIAGREITVSVLDGETLPVVEIIPKEGLYNYEAKYTAGKSKYVVPAELSDELREAVQQAALRAYDAVDASGLARVDFILTEHGEFYCLEVNTIPGMTELSLSPMAAKAAGIDFDQLVQRMIDLALMDKR